MTTTTPAKKTTTRRKTSGKKTVKAPYSKETYVKWHRDMLLMRRFEERCGHLYIQQKFGGFCHLYIGQEAILAGMVEAIRPTDRVITAYRDHAHPLFERPLDGCVLLCHPLDPPSGARSTEPAVSCPRAVELVVAHVLRVKEAQNEGPLISFCGPRSRRLDGEDPILP